jgi:membrane protein DedA with SNARE-associated domain
VESFITDLLDDVASIGPELLLLTAFLLAFAETALFTDLVVPGEVGLIVAGAAAARGEEPHLALLIVAASLGATLGDSVGWLLGKHVGMPLIERFEWTRKRLVPKVERARGYFEKRGGAAVFLGRFVGALRAVVSVVAGMGGMPYQRFLPWNVLASVLWTGLVVSAGYFFGRNVESVVGDIGFGIAGAIVVGALAWWWFRRKHRAKQPAAAG